MLTRRGFIKNLSLSAFFLPFIKPSGFFDYDNPFDLLRSELPHYPMWFNVAFVMPEYRAIFSGDGSLVAIVPDDTRDFRSAKVYDEKVIPVIESVKGVTDWSVAWRKLTKSGRFYNNKGRYDFYSNMVDGLGCLVSEYIGIDKRFFLAKDLIGSLLAESYLNPLANSGKARTIAQISTVRRGGRSNLDLVKLSAKKNNIYFHEHDPLEPVMYRSAYIAWAQKLFGWPDDKGSSVLALSSYHSGLWNVKRVIRFFGYKPHEPVLPYYIRGIVDIRNSRRRIGSFGVHSSIYVEQTLGNNIMVDHLIDTVDQLMVNQYLLYYDISIGEILSETGIDKNTFTKLNPHLRTDVIPSGTAVYIPKRKPARSILPLANEDEQYVVNYDDNFSFGKQRSFWRDDMSHDERLAWKCFRNSPLSHLHVNERHHKILVRNLAEKFARAGNHYMAVAPRILSIM